MAKWDKKLGAILTKADNGSHIRRPDVVTRLEIGRTAGARMRIFR